MASSLIVALVAFGRNCIGLVIRPYETCRRIVERANPLELIPIGILIALVKVFNVRSFLYACLTYCLVVGLFWGIGRILGWRGTVRGLAILWGYSLLPTTLWFFVTSLLYVLLPPPRTTSVQGVIFSLLFLIFSTTLLCWKGTITYLTLRFGLKVGLGKILMVLAITIPILIVYSACLYRLGIFRIPFI